MTSHDSTSDEFDLHEELDEAERRAVSQRIRRALARIASRPDERPDLASIRQLAAKVEEVKKRAGDRQ